MTAVDTSQFRADLALLLDALLELSALPADLAAGLESLAQRVFDGAADLRIDLGDELVCELEPDPAAGAGQYIARVKFGGAALPVVPGTVGIYSASCATDQLRDRPAARPTSCAPTCGCGCGS